METLHTYQVERKKNTRVPNDIDLESFRQTKEEINLLSPRTYVHTTTYDMI
jgi:hypothetical protein